jgi:alanyl-tRNA synthetase
VAAGVRRIEAVTGEAAVAAMQGDRELLEAAGARLKAARPEIPQRIEALLDEVKSLKRDKDKAQTSRATGSIERVLASAVTSGATRILVEVVEGFAGKDLLEICDRLRNQGGSFTCFLISVADGKIALAAAASKDRIESGFHAGKLVKEVALLLGGGGGGRPDVAQGQGQELGKVQEALELARSRVRSSAAGLA